MRKSAGKYNSTFYSTPLKFIENTPTELVLSKPPMLALLNNKAAQTDVQWTVGSTTYAPGTNLVDVVSCQQITADDNGGFTATSSKGDPMVLLPADALSRDGGVCQTLATGQANAAPRAAGARGWAAAVLSLGAAVVAGHLML